jgi:hypothetical protein
MSGKKGIMYWKILSNIYIYIYREREREIFLCEKIQQGVFVPSSTLISDFQMILFFLTLPSINHYFPSIKQGSALEFNWH